MCTFLDLGQKYFLHSRFVISGDNFSEQLFRFACVLETFVVIVDEKDNFVLIFNDPFIIIQHLNHVEL